MALKIASYNMRGFNNGSSMLLELCNMHNLIALQEHWLHEYEFNKFNLLCKDFCHYSVSAMQNRISEDLFRGRPFQGVSILWHNSMNNCVKRLGHDPTNRCNAVKIQTSNRELLLFNVYFPCHVVSAEYSTEINTIIGFIEDTISVNIDCDVVIIGDTNFDCNAIRFGFNMLNDFLSEANIRSCDDFMTFESNDRFTYFNASSNIGSCIDHMFVSSRLFHEVQNITVLDHALNCSDHRPLSVTFSLACIDTAVLLNSSSAEVNNSDQYSLRWDKADLRQYRNYSGQLLNGVYICPKHYNGLCMCIDSDNCADHRTAINKYYSSIVECLTNAEKAFVPKIPSLALKPFWNEYLNELKDKSILWNSIWRDAGKPNSGLLFEIKKNTKYKYKLAIRNAITAYENQHDERIIDNFKMKNSNEFWKSWRKKMNKIKPPECRVNGSNDPTMIANAFMNNFRSTYYDSGSIQAAVNEYNDCLLTNFDNNNSSINKSNRVSGIDEALVFKCLQKLHKGKAAGFDGITAEHLLYADHSVVSHIALLFQCMAIHGFVPDDFGRGIIIPIIKNKLGDQNDVDNYRGITLIPVISKLLELVIFDICETNLKTDELQFGFKKQTGCTNALFVMQETIKYFMSNGSNIFGAALDLKKAFDRVNHYKLFSSLIKLKIPMWIIAVLVNWYSKIYVAVRWKHAFSYSFQVLSGVRQGGPLSPALFNAFVNDNINKLKRLGVGCRIGRHFVGLIMYADDILILSPTLRGLQKMLDTCTDLFNKKCLDFNVNKSSCFNIGSAAKYSLKPLKLQGADVAWSNSLKYLGVNFTFGKDFKVEIKEMKRKFYASSNAILSKTKGFEELARLSLLQSHCLPHLLYAIPALTISKMHINELNIAWNNIYRCIFGFHIWESVKMFIAGIGNLDFNHIWLKSNITFIRNCLLSENYLIKYLINRYIFVNFRTTCEKYYINFSYDNLLYMPLRDIAAKIQKSFMQKSHCVTILDIDAS